MKGTPPYNSRSPYFAWEKHAQAQKKNAAQKNPAVFMGLLIALFLLEFVRHFQPVSRLSWRGSRLS
jgi:hypothetical protein